jgi:hypothetical protein
VLTKGFKTLVLKPFCIAAHVVRALAAIFLIANHLHEIKQKQSRLDLPY